MKEGLSEEEKTQVMTLAADGWPPYRIGKHLKRSPHTIKKFLRQPDVVKEVKDQRTALADKYEAKAERILDSISDEDLKRASLQQKSISSGVCLDKATQLRGEGPVSINFHVMIDLLQAVRDMQK